MASPTEWYSGQYLVSTSSSLLQPTAVNAAFASDALYWTKPMEKNLLKKMLEKSLCFGVYELPNSTSDLAGKINPRQIGLARLITDEVSFAYLTDVYISDSHQGKGLGSWLIKCVNEHISTWPELRRILVIAGQHSKMYEEKLGVKQFPQGGNGLTMFTRKGPGSVMED